ncbi:type I-E CRISPR-associated protein Cse1/CasA [Denitratisoma oestradiolicum]|uniref:Putative CRISPR system Cascade subunit CasA n=1 Tax=Denitratisoma oestradiolicum TaxID=311182 RepID=A0A6S6XYX2_9PROT|nr:type I-E CRISPR-associated protein Cse1/CasA [Denitratisoma oestradiolicum]CAB1368079.1 putative CRISPR system Cascade subunit CasA [Denitratisoma oestradiolicum]
MTISLLDERWIPVLDRDGAPGKIAPWQIAEDEGLRYAALAAPRPDFNGALAQFLIGLLQTAFAPEDDKAWRKLWDAPPTPEQLRQAFYQYREAFVLDGDGPRFMQDLTLRDAEKKAIASLLIDAPGDKTERENKDHFIKRDVVSTVCPHCAAAALFCLQTNAPGGGQGNRVGLRGGGPITTLLIPCDQPSGLWNFLWINILPQDRLLSDGEKREKTFPWLGPTLTSVNDERVTPNSAQANLLQMYWGMPRRIRLQFLNIERHCDLCGEIGQQSISEYIARNFGVSYVGWEHVLSPHNRKAADTLPIPIHGQAGGIGFRHWAGVVVSDVEGKTGGSRKPALILSHHKNSFYRRTISADLWAFGYNMVDNMKARAWVDSRMPLLLASPERQEAFETLSKGYVSAAGEAFGYLRSMAKAAFYGEPSQSGGKLNWSYPPNTPKDGTFYETLTNDYWRRGEADFFAHLRKALECADVAQEQAVAESWLNTLGQLSAQCFDAAVNSVESSDGRVKAVIFARAQLKRMMFGDALRGLLGLPQQEQKTEKSGKGKKRGR